MGQLCKEFCGKSQWIALCAPCFQLYPSAWSSGKKKNKQGVPSSSFGNRYLIVNSPFTDCGYYFLQGIILTDVQIYILFFTPLSSNGRQSEFFSWVGRFSWWVSSAAFILSFLEVCFFPFGLFWNLAICKSLQSFYYLCLPLQMFPVLHSDWMTCKLLWGAPAGYA